MTIAHEAIWDRISVVIPAKNEAEGIVSVIRATQALATEVIVVDGNSTDRTREVSSSTGAKVICDGGRGKGAAYKVGAECATREIVVFLDADGSHRPADIPLLVAPIIDDLADLVIGSRHKGGSDEWGGDLNTYLRSMGSGFLSMIMNYRWNANLTDCLNGFRAARRSALLDISWSALDFDVEQHMIAEFLKRRYRVTEVAAHEYCRAWGHSKLPTYRKAYLFFWRLFCDLVTR